VKKCSCRNTVENFLVIVAFCNIYRWLSHYRRMLVIIMLIFGFIRLRSPTFY
jgi:hypothetical protein